VTSRGSNNNSLGPFHFIVGSQTGDSGGIGAGGALYGISGDPISGS
jgi:hypothetical protein